MTLSRLVATVAVAFGLIQLDSRVEAGITGLYDTGVNGTGSPLANGAVDTHYQLSYTEAPGGSPVTPGSSLTYAVNPSPPAFPVPPWAPNDAVSSWISANPSINGGTQDPDGYYAYHTTFTVTGSLAGLSITGLFSADDQVAFLLNPTGPVNPASLTFTPDQGYGSLYPLSITTGFQTGLNNLYFVVANTHEGPEGLRVEFNSTVPEPASFAMLGLGLFGVIGHLGYRRTRNRAVASA
jgi:PEP-CTERM motif